jgi:hypothetical protein
MNLIMNHRAGAVALAEVMGRWLKRRVVSISLISCFAVVVAAAAAGCSRATNDPLGTKVTLTKPYPLDYEGDETNRISVQYAVMDLARQAGLGYDWGASQTNAGEACRIWTTPDLEGVPLREALTNILEPQGLTYDIEGGKIVLKKG